MKSYRVFETKSVFIHRFVLPADNTMSEAEFEQLLNEGILEEFMQKHVGEEVTSARVMTEDEILKLDNDYISTLDDTRQRDLLTHWASRNSEAIRSV